jgi:predicted O-methyltransferase YrrM
MNDWIRQLYLNKDLLTMGHCQSEENLNLGMGWLYYGFTRLLRPQLVVVIGSLRGFAPLVFAKALLDNQDGGTILFIDPSYADDFWKVPHKTDAYFAQYGVTNIKHRLMTTQEFVRTSEYENLKDVGIVFIDGYHTDEQARFDYEAFENRITRDGVAMFHDSVTMEISRIYGPEQTYIRNVKLYMDHLKQRPELQVFDVPFEDGLTIVRKIR